MFMALTNDLVVLFYCCATADILTKLLQQCSLFFIIVRSYLDNSQVSVYRTIGPTLVSVTSISILYFYSNDDDLMKTSYSKSCSILSLKIPTRFYLKLQACLALLSLQYLETFSVHAHTLSCSAFHLRLESYPKLSFTRGLTYNAKIINRFQRIILSFQSNF